MTEKKFIQQNIEKWRELEGLLEKSTHDPDQLHQLFVKVSSDLSYARTFYPNRSVRLYLNRLTQEVFDKLGKKKTKFDLSFLNDFFSHVLPLEIYRSRKAFYISFVVFALAVLIGVISAKNNLEFVTVILGDAYIEMTEANINKGDPMAVYKDSDQLDMFFGITLNNIKVAFYAFVLGLIGIIGTVFILLYNGIMLGAFQYYFYAKGLFMTSFLTIWIHGTIEISAIIIAGAAGIILGSGLLFPGTYKRTTSLQISAIRALRLVMGTIPLFILAGMLESFVTRLTDMPTALKVAIIGGSLLLILWMWVYYPWYYNRKHKGEIRDVEIIPSADVNIEAPLIAYRNIEDNFSLSIAHYKNTLPGILKKIILPSILFLGFAFWYDLIFLDELALVELVNLYSYNDRSIWFYLLFSLIATFSLLYLAFQHSLKKEKRLMVRIKKTFLDFLVLGILIVSPIYFSPAIGFTVAFFIVLPPHFFVIMSLEPPEFENDSFFEKFKKSFYVAWSRYLNFVVEYIVALLLFAAILALLNSQVVSIVKDFFMWHQIFEIDLAAQIFLKHIYRAIAFLLVLPFFFFAIANKYFSLLCRDKGYDLEDRFKNFGQHSNVLESV